LQQAPVSLSADEVAGPGGESNADVLLLGRGIAQEAEVRHGATVGLHNKYPSYFYKRGNLFNTYLGHTDAPGGSAPARPQKPVRQRTVTNSPASELHSFALLHFKESQVRTFVERVSLKIGSPPPAPTDDPRQAMRRLIFRDLTVRQQRSYLAELERRCAARELLIKP